MELRPAVWIADGQMDIQIVEGGEEAGHSHETTRHERHRDGHLPEATR